MAELKAEMIRMKQQIFMLQNFCQKTVNDSRAESSDRLQKKGGSGHFYERDQCKTKGGQRDEMNADDVRQILKLLSLGQEKVNFKFMLINLNFKSVNVEAYGWKLNFSICFKDIDSAVLTGEPDWVFTLGIKEKGKKFKTLDQYY